MTHHFDAPKESRLMLFLQRVKCFFVGHWWTRESLYRDKCPCCKLRRWRRN